jgi:hypothetical protein
MGSLFDKVAALWPTTGPLSTALGQRAALGVFTALAAAVPLGWREDFVVVLAEVMLVGLLVLVSGLYLQRSEPGVWERLRDLSILSVLVLGVVYGTWLVAVFVPTIPPFVLPIPLSAVLATLLLNPRVGVLLAILGSGVAVLFGVLEGAHVVGALIAAAAGATAMASVRDRSRLASAGGLIVVVTGAAALGASVLEGDALASALRAGALGVGGGVLTVGLVLLLLPLFERVFGVTTDVRLLEVAAPSHPLLQRLMMEAPGTYSHSVMTANLAEAAAAAVGANRLLTRVGAYYHDVGKLRRPGFFAENQSCSANPHDNTTPALSALIITAHVTEGVQLAEEYRLPREIVDVIRQHHGTSIVSYFYSKATAKGEPVVEADYRYSGELPTSREAALVMLADASEAAMRSLTNPTPERIAGVVRKVIETKRADHQLDLSDLTIADIELVTGVYAQMLEGVYHPRIEYPEFAEGSDQHAGQRQQPSRA